MKKIILLSCLLIFASKLFSQAVPNTNTTASSGITNPDSTVVAKPIRKPIDGIYDKTHIYNRTPIQYVPLREADAMWSKKVWRRLDLREKINHPLHFPNQGLLDQSTTQGNWFSFWDVIYRSLDSSETNPYPLMIYTDEFCNIPMPFNQFISKLGISTTVPKWDMTQDPPVQIGDTVKIDITKKSKFLAIDLKEVWFLDKQRSVLDVRIIALRPVIWKPTLMSQITAGGGGDPSDTIDDGMNDDQPSGVGWLYFPEIRPVLANNDAFNNFNTSEMKSYDDIFWKRFFSSFVQREENIYNNREINNFILNGMDQVLESERITNEIRKFEHDMWEF